MLSGKFIPPPVVINFGTHPNSFSVAYALAEEKTAPGQGQISSSHLLVPLPDPSLSSTFEIFPEYNLVSEVLHSASGHHSLHTTTVSSPGKASTLLSFAFGKKFSLRPG